MKKSVYFLFVMVIGILVTTWYSCEEDPEETCEQDEFCEEIIVTTCCTDTECVWKYNGKEYTSDQEDELAQLLQCGTKSAGEANDLSSIVEKLRAIMDRVREQTQSAE